MISLTTLPQVRERREELRLALQQRNAVRVADLLKLPPVSSPRAGSGAQVPSANDSRINQYRTMLSSNSATAVELMEGTGNSGSTVDWTNVFKSWLLASYAANVVSFWF
jgi:hypothetical protein